ncbi:hypothetical protein E4T43_04542 [Aureobasidium subglaciale]|nr:hypothetical protein E4T43_04542 [Aureobasidium subglaciale]
MPLSTLSPPPPPPPISASPDEKIAGLSALLTQWYTLHLLSTFQPVGTCILHPPHSPSASVLSSWKAAEISETSIHVLKNIPYLSGEGRRDIAPDTRALNWMEDEFAPEVWKDILGDDGEKEGQTGNEKTREGKDCVPLTYRVGEGGVVLLLDIRKIMEYGFVDALLMGR